MNKPLSTQELDALVLAGGESSRMGSPKALLPLGSTTVLEKVLEVLLPLFRRVLVVARDPKDLAGLGGELLTDGRPERGPLVGLARGLAASAAPWCFVVGCDMPFLCPEVIRRMAGHLGDCDILAPHIGGRLQPLHAFYTIGCLPHATELLEHGDTSLHGLFARCRVRTLGAPDFLDLDPDLRSFCDLDTKADYRAAQSGWPRGRKGQEEPP